jgi:hypothetical protein
MMVSAIRRLGIALALLAGAARAETVSLRLKDGSVVRGEILNRTDSTVTIRNTALGEITVRARDIIADAGDAGRSSPGAGATADSPDAASAQAASARTSGADPADQALFFMPTAFLPPARAFTFRDFELLFIAFGYSPGARTAISAGFLFPITPEAQVITAGLKQNLWNDGAGAALSITGNLTKPLADLSDDLGLFANANLVASKRFKAADGETAFGIHGAAGYLGHRERYRKFVDTEEAYRTAWEWQGDFSFGIVCEGVLTPNAKFIAEYVSAAALETDNSFKGGLMTVGFRLHGARLAADIAGVRPFLGNGWGELILWPLLVVSYRI